MRGLGGCESSEDRVAVRIGQRTGRADRRPRLRQTDVDARTAHASEERVFEIDNDLCVDAAGVFEPFGAGAADGALGADLLTVAFPLPRRAGAEDAADPLEELIGGDAAVA